jgi:hypothetical protein
MTNNQQHDAACAQITSITQHGRAMGRALIIAIDAMEAMDQENDDGYRHQLHQRARDDIHAIIGEVL